MDLTSPKLFQLMVKPIKHHVPTIKNDIANANPSKIQAQTVTHYQGLIPPPDFLRGLDELVPGTAERLIRLVSEESQHRRDIEIKITNANISAQQTQLQIASQQSKAVFRSDLIGQIAGLFVCIICVAGAVYLGVQNHHAPAIALAAIPTAAIIRAFTLTGKRKAESLPKKP